MQLTVAIFKDESDAGLWAAYLDGISALLRITAHNDLRATFQRMIGLGIEPGLVILSSRLYPRENPHVAALVRDYFPAAELLLVSSSEEPSPPLSPLHADNVRHLVVNPPNGGDVDKGYFDCVLSKLVAGRPLAIGDRLKEQTEVRVLELGASDEKETLLRAVDAAIAGEGEESDMFRQRVALLADELVENALYGAPRHSDGGTVFKKGEARAVLPGERLIFSFGFDGETLAMEMTDNWGTLDPDLVVEHLARNQEQLESSDSMGGRGLFLIWRFFDHFHIAIEPGKKTTVGGDLQLSRKLDPEAPRGFHIISSKNQK